MKQKPAVLLYPVKDLARSKALYQKLLGVEPYVDSAYYVGFRVPDMEIGLAPIGPKGWTGPIGFWDVEDVKKSLQLLVDSGAQTHEDVRDVGGGMLIASVKDVDGNVIGLRQSPS